MGGKHATGTTVPGVLHENTEGIVVGYHKLLHTLSGVIEPELAGIKRSTVRSEQLNFDLLSAHVEAPGQHICLTIQVLVLALDVSAVIKIGANVVPKVSHIGLTGDFVSIYVKVSEINVFHVL